MRDNNELVFYSSDKNVFYSIMSINTFPGIELWVYDDYGCSEHSIVTISNFIDLKKELNLEYVGAL